MISNQMIIDAKNGDSSAVEKIVSECQKEVYAITKSTVTYSTASKLSIGMEVCHFVMIMIIL